MLHYRLFLATIFLRFSWDTYLWSLYLLQAWSSVADFWSIHQHNLDILITKNVQLGFYWHFCRFPYNVSMMNVGQLGRMKLLINIHIRSCLDWASNVLCLVIIERHGWRTHDLQRAYDSSLAMCRIFDSWSLLVAPAPAFVTCGTCQGSTHWTWPTSEVKERSQ